jgi:lipopolysaccharide export LptBFGC system permease protein LptF
MVTYLMRTLDRYVVRSFLAAAAMLLVAIMALRIVSDLFFNMDEFVENYGSFAQMAANVARYYSYQSLMYFAELGGVIIVVAAAFTLARMNHTNELTAMLASGVSLHRVIVPMIVSAMLMGGLVVLDRELLVPPNAEHLVRSRDDAKEVRKFPVTLTPDANGTVWWSPMFDPATRTMLAPILTIRGPDHKRLASVVSTGEAQPGTFRQADGTELKGWDMTQASLARAGQDQGQGLGPVRGKGAWENTPTYRRIFTSRLSPSALLDKAKAVARQHGIPVPSDDRIPSVSGIPPAVDPSYGMTLTTRCPSDQDELVLGPVPKDKDKQRGGRLNQPVFTFALDSPAAGTGPDAKPQHKILGIFHARSATWMPGESPGKSHWLLEDARLFYPSDLEGKELFLRHSSKWLDLMSTSELTDLIHSGRIPNREAAVLAKHIRFAEPINNLLLLLLAMPFILSRERNIKASAGLSVLMVGSYFAFIHICRLVGLPPIMAAFLPILLFGTVAAVMMDSVKT